MSIQQLREEVCEANRALPKAGLVTMHSGNASGYDAETGHLVIKPSGIDYEKLRPEMLVEVDVSTGRVLDSNWRPSVDLPHHLHLYRHDRAIRGVVHTHSNYATAFASCHMSIPLCLTAIADEFGDEIPCAPFAECDEHAIGQSIMQYRKTGPAILLANHGIFTWGNCVQSAFKAAVMTEDVAKTVFLALQIGQPTIIPFAAAAKYHDRYKHRYGQRAA